MISDKGGLVPHFSQSCHILYAGICGEVHFFHSCEAANTKPGGQDTESGTGQW